MANRLSKYAISLLDDDDRNRYLLILLPSLFLIVVFLLPLLRIFVLSFSDPAGIWTTYVEIFRGAVYWRIMGNTLSTAAYVTIVTLVLAYPMAYVLNHLAGIRRAIVYWCVLLPFWVSALVRTFSWMLILDRRGPVNQLLLAVGLTDRPLAMLFSNFAVYLGMVHIMIPFAVVPISTGMAGIDRRLLLASDGLGASPLRSFCKIYLPLSLPGVYAAASLVFVLSLGFFITPALLGGQASMTWALLIENLVNERLALPLAAAASMVLLLITLVIVAAAAKAFPTLRAKGSQ